MSVPDLRKAIASRDYSGSALEYSWFGGLGHGDVVLHLDGNGDCRLKLISREPPSTKEYRARVSNSRVHEIFSAVNSTGVLSLIPEARGYRVYDLGRFDIAVSVDGVTRDVIFDEQRTVDSPDAFLKAREVVLSLSQELGVEFDWGPYATTVGSSD